VSPSAQVGTLAVAALLSCRAARPHGPPDAGERLGARLVVRDAQGGFVGETATVTTIEPDGTFRIASLVNGRALAPERTGRLAPEALRALARTLATELAEPLPPSIEAGRAAANPHRVQITYGEASSALVLPAGSAPGAAAPAFPEGEAAARFVRIWSAARALEPGGAPPGAPAR
jgi:hypothetical protein